MRPSPSLLSKASRFQLSSKHANKDYYKGRRQSHPDGIGFRTGPPGAHHPSKSWFRVDDHRARFFVGPAFKPGSSEFAFDAIKPYASTSTPPTAGYPWGLPGARARRAEWYGQMAAEIPVWDALREEQERAAAERVGQRREAEGGQVVESTSG